jgi:hypothetical protein
MFSASVFATVRNAKGAADRERHQHGFRVPGTFTNREESVIDWDRNGYRHTVRRDLVYLEGSGRA